MLGFCDLDLDTEKFPSDFKFDTENVNFPLKSDVLTSMNNFELLFRSSILWIDSHD